MAGVTEMKPSSVPLNVIAVIQLLIIYKMNSLGPKGACILGHKCEIPESNSCTDWLQDTRTNCSLLRSVIDFEALADKSKALQPCFRNIPMPYEQFVRSCGFPPTTSPLQHLFKPTFWPSEAAGCIAQHLFILSFTSFWNSLLISHCATWFIYDFFLVII